ncbi:GNAT family N-acetyltransferase [Pseudooceanicola sp. LIPI14-2-Ac024]|uniref:GNAT family N-acetyltransferase n=1 Tax=Pseudooceanicola sp. LIPI14-2-Ac024 TaxID=3344875 RepID=UPI0035CF1D58
MTLRITETEDLRIPHDLRRAVFVVEQNIPDPEEWDDLDAGAIHVVGWVDDTPAGTIRLVTDADGTGHITRVCVLAAYRGTGLGAEMIRHGIARFDAMGLRAIELSAQTHARTFYARLGFVATGAEYDDAGIPHVRMVRRQPDPADAAAR